MSPLCLWRSFVGLLRLGPRISGHAYIEQQPEYNQPLCVTILKCSVCGHVEIGWKECDWCGATPVIGSKPKSMSQKMRDAGFTPRPSGKAIGEDE